MENAPALIAQMRALLESAQFAAPEHAASLAYIRESPWADGTAPIG